MQHEDRCGSNQKRGKKKSRQETLKTTCLLPNIYGCLLYLTDMSDNLGLWGKKHFEVILKIQIDATSKWKNTLSLNVCVRGCQMRGNNGKHLKLVLHIHTVGRLSRDTLKKKKRMVEIRVKDMYCCSLVHSGQTKKKTHRRCKVMQNHRGKTENSHLNEELTEMEGARFLVSENRSAR